MSRKGTIFSLTHFYPLFLATHAYFGDWCTRCQLMFTVVPLLIFGGLIITWYETSNIKLCQTERIYLRYFLLNLFFITCYYCLCILSLPKWVYASNTKAAGFLAITFLFYIYSYLRHEQR